jgi:hypothetical protein
MIFIDEISIFLENFIKTSETKGCTKFFTYGPKAFKKKGVVTIMCQNVELDDELSWLFTERFRAFYLMMVKSFSNFLLFPFSST